MKKQGGPRHGEHGKTWLKKSGVIIVLLRHNSAIGLCTFKRSLSGHSCMSSWMVSGPIQSSSAQLELDTADSQLNLCLDLEVTPNSWKIT